MTLPKQKTTSKHFVILAVLLAIGGGFVWYKDTHRAEAHQPAPPPPPAFTVTPDWPHNIAAAAVGVKGSGVLAATSGDSRPRPIASIAKLITALAILEKHPLQGDAAGPDIPITAADEQLYRDYVAKNGTVVLVKAGVPITERDALEGMLLPSANNIADTAAIWAFGSLKKYHEYASAMLQRLGLHNTTIGIDASGLDPSTKSTASDLVRLGDIALDNPVIAHIAALPSATIPFAGPIPNYNAMVTKYGYTGLKPGESVEAGNTLLFSTDEVANGRKLTIIGAILGSAGYKQSDAGALQIVQSVKDTIKPNPAYQP